MSQKAFEGKNLFAGLNSNREGIDTACDILLSLSDGGKTKLDLMYHVITSYQRVEGYLKWLAERRLVERRKDGEIRITTMGKAFLDHYLALRELAGL